MNDLFSRREAVKWGTLTVGGLTLFGMTACFDKKKDKTAQPAATEPVAKPAANTAPSGDPLIALDHASAKGLKYAHDGSTVDAALKVEKSGVAGADQSCLNCQFYKPVDGKDYGKCQLIPVPGKHVAAKGWCVTWAKKA